LPEFLDSHPNLELELVLDDKNIDLVEEGIDVALRMGVLADSNMTARKLSEAQRRVVATPEYLKQHGSPKIPADLLAHQVVIYTRDAGGGEDWKFRKETAEVSVKIQGRVKITATEGLRAAVLADMGLAIASEWAFTPELKSGAVVSVMDDWVLPPISLSAVYPTGRLASVKARQFATFVEKCLTT